MAERTTFSSISVGKKKSINVTNRNKKVRNNSFTAGTTQSKLRSVMNAQKVAKLLKEQVENRKMYTKGKSESAMTVKMNRTGDNNGGGPVEPFLLPTTNDDITHTNTAPTYDSPRPTVGKRRVTRHNSFTAGVSSDNNVFAEYHFNHFNMEDSIFKSPPSKIDTNSVDGDVSSSSLCDILFDILDSTAFEGFAVFLVMVLAIILLIGEYYVALMGTASLNIGLEVTTMTLVSFFVLEMFFKVITFRCAFMAVKTNVAG